MNSCRTAPSCLGTKYLGHSLGSFLQYDEYVVIISRRNIPATQSSSADIVGCRLAPLLSSLPDISRPCTTTVQDIPDRSETCGSCVVRVRVQATATPVSGEDSVIFLAFYHHIPHLVLFDSVAHLDELLVHRGGGFVVLHLVVAVAQQRQGRSVSWKILLTKRT